MNVEAVRLALFATLGAVTAAAYVRALVWNVQLYCGRTRAPLAIFFHLMRLSGVGAIFVVAAKCGAGPLLSTFAGFQLVRLFAVRTRSMAEETVS